MDTERPTRILLIRHGETANAPKRCYNGHNDIALSKNGIKQVEEKAKLLKEEPISAVYSSTLSRSYKSACLIADEHNISVIQQENLREISYGRWEGMALPEIKERFPDEINLRFSNYLDYRIKEGGESLTDLNTRILAALKILLHKHKGETIALALHGGVNKVILGWALGMELKNIPRIKQDFAALNIISFYPSNGEMMVELING